MTVNEAIETTRSETGAKNYAKAALLLARKNNIKVDDAFALINAVRFGS